MATPPNAETPLAQFADWPHPRLETSCRRSRSRCNLVHDTRWGAPQYNPKRWKFYCQICSHESVSGFQFCHVCGIWVNVNKIPNHLDRLPHTARVIELNVPAEHAHNIDWPGHEPGAVENPESPNDVTAPVDGAAPTFPLPADTAMVQQGEQNVIDDLGDLDDEDLSVILSVLGDDAPTAMTGGGEEDSVNGTAATFAESMNGTTSTFPDETLLNGFFENDSLVLTDECLPTTMAVDQQAPAMDLDVTSLVSAELNPERVWWKNRSVKLKLSLRLDANAEAYGDSFYGVDYRPQNDYLRVHILSPEEQQRLTGVMPSRPLALHADFHANLQSYNFRRDGPTLFVDLAFNTFDAKENIFGHAMHELPVEEVHGTASLRFQGTVPEFFRGHAEIVHPIVFYRRPDDVDYAHQMELISRMASDLASARGNIDPAGFVSGFSAMTQQHPQQQQGGGGGKRPRSHGTNSEWVLNSSGPEAVAFLAADRALVVIARNFRASDPPATMLLELESTAEASDLPFMLHDHVEARLGSLVRSMVAKNTVIKRAGADPRFVADVVLEFLGCDFALVEHWAKYRISTFLASKKKLQAVIDRGAHKYGRRGCASLMFLRRNSTTSSDDSVVRSPRTQRRTLPNIEFAAARAQELLASEARHLDGDGYEIFDDDDDEQERTEEEDEEKDDAAAPPFPKKQRARTVFGTLRRADTELAQLASQEDDDDFAEEESFGRKRLAFHRALSRSQPSELSDDKHVPEAERVARDWMERVLNCEFQRPLAEEVSDGSVICELVNRIKLEAVPCYFETPSEDEQRENIDAFLAAAESLGVSELFEPADLLSSGDFGRVVKCLLALAQCSERQRSDLPKLHPVHTKFSRLIASLVPHKDDDDEVTDDAAEDAPAKKSGSFLSGFFPSLFGTSPHQKAKKHHSDSTGEKQKSAVSFTDDDDDDESKTTNKKKLVARLDVSGAIVTEQTDAKPSPLIVWSKRDKRSAAFDNDERNLCRLLRRKGKLFEVVYLDITPEREATLKTICQGKEVSLPALTVSAEHLSAVQELEDSGDLDRKLSIVPPGSAFWVMPKPDEWNVQHLGTNA